MVNKKKERDVGGNEEILNKIDFGSMYRDTGTGTEEQGSRTGVPE